MFRQNIFFCFHAIKGLLAPIWQNDELVGHRGSTMQATPVDIQCVLKNMLLLLLTEATLFARSTFEQVSCRVSACQ